MWKNIWHPPLKKQEYSMEQYTKETWYAAFTSIAIVVTTLCVIVWMQPDSVDYEEQTYLISDEFKKGDRMGSATGVWVDSTHVLTNCHVVEATFMRDDGYQSTWEELDNEVEVEAEGSPDITITLITHITEEEYERPTYSGETYAISSDGVRGYTMNNAVCAEGADLGLLTSTVPNLDVTPITHFNEAGFGEKVWSVGYGGGAALALKEGLVGMYETDFRGRWLNVVIPAIPGDSGSPLYNNNGLTGLLSRAMFMGIDKHGQRFTLGDKMGFVPSREIKDFLREQGIIQ
jgi:hypothetical protein